MEAFLSNVIKRGSMGKKQQTVCGTFNNVDGQVTVVDVGFRPAKIFIFGYEGANNYYSGYYDVDISNNYYVLGYRTSSSSTNAQKYAIGVGTKGTIDSITDTGFTWYGSNSWHIRNFVAIGYGDVDFEDLVETAGVHNAGTGSQYQTFTAEIGKRYLVFSVRINTSGTASDCGINSGATVSKVLINNITSAGSVGTKTWAAIVTATDTTVKMNGSNVIGLFIPLDTVKVPLSETPLVKTGVATLSASAPTKITCGFKPKYICAFTEKSGGTAKISNIYNEEYSETKGLYSSTNTSSGYIQEYTLGASGYYIKSIDNDGFTLNTWAAAWLGPCYYTAIG